MVLNKDQYVESKTKDYKTSCCNKPYYKKGRADLRCMKCDADVTMEIVLLADLFEREYKSKNTIR